MILNTLSLSDDSTAFITAALSDKTSTDKHINQFFKKRVGFTSAFWTPIRHSTSGVQASFHGDELNFFLVSR